MQPISPVAREIGGTSPLHEAVVRFGAAQETREQQRSERAADDRDATATIDEAFIDVSDASAPEAPSGARGEAPSPQGARSADGRAKAEGATLGGRGVAEEGLDEQQSQAIAQHAAEQQGKRENVRLDGDRAQRSTREMMGRVGAAGKVESKASTAASSSGTSASSSASAPSGRESAGGGNKAEASAHSAPHSHGAPVSSGGGHPTAGASHAGSPRVGGDVLAAAVGSGLAPTEEVTPGSAQSRDRDDDNAQDVESSREGMSARGDDARKQVARERPLDGQTGFHDGDGGGDDPRRSPGERRRGTGGQPSSSGSGSGESGGSGFRPREQQADPAELSADSEPTSPTEPAGSARADERDARAASPAVSGESEPSVRPREADAAASAAPAAPIDSPSPAASPVADAPADATASAKGNGGDGGDRVVRAPQASAPSPGLGPFGGEEYFFFDDARSGTEPPAEGETNA